MFICLSLTSQHQMCQGSGARITDLKTLKNGPNDYRIMFYREPKTSELQWTWSSVPAARAAADLLPILGAAAGWRGRELESETGKIGNRALHIPQSSAPAAERARAQPWLGESKWWPGVPTLSPARSLCTDKLWQTGCINNSLLLACKRGPLKYWVLSMHVM